jgi:hypothetical protein
MSRLPRGDGKIIVDRRITVVPIHSGEIIGAGLLTKNNHNCDMTREEFEQLL